MANRRSFITWHTVKAQQQGPPSLGPAQPLTTAFVEDLAESLSGQGGHRGGSTGAMSVERNPGSSQLCLLSPS